MTKSHLSWKTSLVIQCAMEVSENQIPHSFFFTYICMYVCTCECIRMLNPRACTGIVETCDCTYVRVYTTIYRPFISYCPS